ncbi:hypothetical protein SAMN05216338_104558 [Bradyrhizobium sp. Rc2d]|nr:hypothetical protein SAMN05216338_104558 [Bradyrhizobium sp. Rc2d]
MSSPYWPGEAGDVAFRNGVAASRDHHDWDALCGDLSRTHWCRTENDDHIDLEPCKLLGQGWKAF